MESTSWWSTGEPLGLNRSLLSTGGPTPGTPAHPTSLLPSKPCGFEATYLELASAVKEEYPGIEIESRLGGTGEVRRAPAESVHVINFSSPTF